MNFLYLSTGDLWPCYISFKLPSSNEFLSINLMVFFLFPLSNFLNFFDLVENNVSSLTLQFDGKNIHVMRKFPILPSGRPRMASPGGPKTKQDENLPIRTSISKNMAHQGIYIHTERENSKQPKSISK